VSLYAQKSLSERQRHAGFLLVLHTSCIQGPESPGRGINNPTEELDMTWVRRTAGAVLFGAVLVAMAAYGQEVKKRGETSFMPVDSKEPFESVMRRLKADKAKVRKRQMDRPRSS
jgi:hypothetical protein